MCGIDRKQRLGLIAISALQGLVLWCLYSAAKRAVWPVTEPAWFHGLLAPAILVPPLIYLVLGLATSRRIAGLAAGASALLFALGWHFGARVLGDSQASPENPYAFALPVIVLCFHALPFVQSAFVTGRIRPEYPRLFEFAWRNALLVALALVFTGVLWLLFLLWAQLFDMIGIRFFGRVFRDSRFAIPVTSVAFAVGIGLAGSVERLQDALRQHLLGLFKWLAILAFVILTLFTIALIGKSPELFASGRRVISATWLLWLLVFCVYLLNAAYQDGSADRPYPRAIGAFLRHAMPLLVVVALLALYALGVRVGAYGLTVARIWALLVAVLALIYAAGYTWAAFRRGPWMAGMGQVNIVAALVLIGALLLMLTPVLSPYRFAAGSQEARALASASPAAAKPLNQDAFWALRFDTGRYGTERLARLAQLENHPDAAAIRDRAREMQQRKRRYAGTDPLSQQELALIAYPEGRTLSPSLRAAMVSASRLQGSGDCVQETGGCPVLFVDLDEDGRDEAVLFRDQLPQVFSESGGEWRHVGSGAVASVFGGNTEPLTRARAGELLASGSYRVVAPPLRSIEIGGRVVEFTAEPPPR